ncbi:FecR family protein [Carboxylicivirga sp. M1479]|uniref:FecR family protein n=1 Tax=Carboxylicivirga sp. M1479 TaxID=2594476 RepID=UPI0011780BE8|nr:FecR domain-containing protein [Carboxylicivirga sp. M1479]TRX66477.1 DUF4974 domain-containing protein [Carboxylicivirga sp. M1479]
MREEDKNISWSLLAKDLSGELSEEEHMKLQEELTENPDIEKQVKKLWGDVHYAQTLKSIDTSKAWKTVDNQITTKNNKFKLRLYTSVAASIIVIVASYLFLNIVSEYKQTTITTSQAIEQITLPDGTSVDLNFGSSITYPKNFSKEKRLVKLSGEAFFDVKRDESKPFVIETEDLNIQVLGTSFNVKAYSGSTKSEVVVASGKVRVDAKNNTENYVLEAGDAASYSSSSNTLAVHKVSSLNYKAWKTKEIEFNNTHLNEVIKTIEQTYHITIVLDKEVLTKEKQLNATFSQHSLDHVLESVCQTFNFSYSKDKGTYYISNK